MDIPGRPAPFSKGNRGMDLGERRREKDWEEGGRGKLQLGYERRIKGSWFCFFFKFLSSRHCFSGVNPTAPESDENLKPSLSAEIQSKGHHTPGLWRQPKDGKEWGEEYVTKDHPDKLKDAGQGRHSSLENVLCETSLAGKS